MSAPILTATAGMCKCPGRRHRRQSGNQVLNWRHPAACNLADRAVRAECRPLRVPPMLFRFSLYGFLKNQRYFEPFLVLAFMEKGLSFFLIGTLIMVRDVTVNLLEIPSGSIADICGRRGSMILAFVAYLISYLIFGFADAYAGLLVAMLFFAVGDSFRSGTHKAMIFTWLRLQGREDERTRVYGFTRSWSKIGSAVSCCLAAVFVFTDDNYSHIFFYAAVPCVLSVINFLG